MRSTPRYEHPRGHAWEVRCNQCGELRWPISPEKPRTYTCVRCCSGAGGGYKHRGRGEKRAPGQP
jgi:hypothetical protein